MAPFSRRSTALDVVEGIDLSGKTAVVTGGNRFVCFVNVQVYALGVLCANAGLCQAVCSDVCCVCSTAALA